MRIFSCPAHALNWAVEVRDLWRQGKSIPCEPKIGEDRTSGQESHLDAISIIGIAMKYDVIDERTGESWFMMWYVYRTPASEWRAINKRRLKRAQDQFYEALKREGYLSL